MIHINLNMILYTHVEHSPTKTICIKYYTGKTNTHTHYTLLGLCSLKFKMRLLDPPEIWNCYCSITLDMSDLKNDTNKRPGKTVLMLAGWDTMVQKSTILSSNPSEVSTVKSCSIPQLNTLGVDRHMELYIANYIPYGERNTSVTF